jgi:hypothetical protein
MDDGRVLALLAAGDRSARLPRLGGMARPAGVLIASERFWAFAGGDATASDGTMPRAGLASRRLPLVRGLVRLGAALWPLFHARGVARRPEQLVFGALLLLPLPFAFLPSAISLWLGIASSGGFLVWLLRGRTLQLHGAEHRAIAAAESRQLVATWSGTAHPSRFAPRCGTNFAALALPMTFLLERWSPFAPAFYTSLLLTMFSLALTMEVWQAVHAAPPWLARIALSPGLALQRLTTREPRLEETRVALRALATVLALELEDPHV